MEDNNTGIAIVGMAGRFPDASNIRDFWRNLARGHESLVEFSDQEILAAGVSAELLADPNYVKRGTVLEGSDRFDAGFFGFNPREAEVIDPQQRVFLECAWEALEDAGYAGDSTPEATGVFAGTSINTYMIANIMANPGVVASVGEYQLMLACDKDFLATRVAYKLNLRGPAMSVQTACSTSLVAVNLACQQLLQGSCAMAMAGGVSITFPERSGYLYHEGMILSPDGRCRPFDAQGRGIRAGAGAGVVVLKRLEDAIRDRDHIRAVIRGVAINNDGSAKMGYTAPSVDGQAEAILAAHRMAGVDPASISYIEAHGTATVVGDPIEITALTKAFRTRTEKKQFCAVGSVKGNLGHLDAAAGVAGLVKTVLALEHKALPPSIHFEIPNPQIDFESSPFFVSRELRPWPADGAPRRAGVSSFGIGGTNAHTLLEEAPEPVAQVKSWNSALITVSARSAEGLDRAAANLSQYLAENPETDLFDACYTLQAGRKHFPYRRALVAANVEQAIAALQARKTAALPRDGFNHPVVFLFSGQGSQYVRMGERVHAFDPTFRSAFDQCAEILQPHLGLDLREAIYGTDANTELLNETWLTQPALFAVEYSLARMWMHWGVLPAAMIGHSIGEYAAACIAGVFSLEDALKVVAVRGRLMQGMPKGSMLAVPMSAERLRPVCRGGVEMAAINAPELCTLSGPDAAIEEVHAKLEAHGTRCRRIHTSHAFHSAAMDGVLGPFVETLRSTRLSAPKIPFVSNLTGRHISEAEATDPAYWATHLRHTVRFADGLSELMAADSPILLEVGPGDVLATFARQSRHAAKEVVSSLPHPQSPANDADHVLTTLGRLWTTGVPVDWAAFHEHERLRRVPLPTYPFERQRYCVEPQREAPAASKQAQGMRPRPGVSGWFYVPSWNEMPLPPAHPADGKGDDRTWLVFANSGGASAAVVDALADAQRVAVVTSGSEYFRVAAGVYTIAPGSRGHYIRLIGDLVADGYDPDVVVHAWNATTGAEDCGPPEDRSFFSLLFLAQAFAERGGTRFRQLLVVSDGVHAVMGDEQTAPENALCLGPVKVIPKELPHLQTRAVDLPPHATAEQYRAYAANLLREPLAQDGGRIVAYRGSKRWQQVYRPLALPEPGGDLPLRPNGVYLITGGLGGIGLVIARHFAAKAQARLILTSRSKFPERRDWEGWLAEHGEQDQTSQRIRELLEIEAAGGRVFVGVADVADEPAMKVVIQQAHALFGPIHGVVHAAGIAGGGLIELKAREAAEAVLAPKVRGTRVLERLIAPDHPDFVLLCSSIDAIVGGVGSIDYCAANLFLDACALLPNTFGGARVLSIGWDSWQETGMAVSQDVPQPMRAARAAYLREAIRNEEGMEALHRLFATTLNQVAVIPHDLPSVLEQAESASRKPAVAIAPGDAAVPSTLDGHTANGFSGTQQHVVAIWKEMLGVRDIGLDDNFFELGGHSLLGTGVLSRIRKQYGITVPLRALFEAPTVRELANHVDTLLWALQSTDAGPRDTSEEREEIEL
jgi:acyl transferase domain-containing protein